MTRPAPIVAAVLLILPVLYVGSYLALVVPSGTFRTRATQFEGFPQTERWQEHYRAGPVQTASFFWPLEQIDRRVRPRAWKIANDSFPTPHPNTPPPG